jgi:mono/diheme cytochrome c family protein
MARALGFAFAMYVAAAVTAAQTPTPRTVWDGVFTAEQAARGRAQYATTCARCHGAALEGGMGASLIGTPFWNKWRDQGVADLLGYVSKNMPMGVQASVLSPAVYADIVAYLLRSNDLPAGTVDLTATSGVDVRIVPQGGSTGALATATLARVVGCLAPAGSDQEWRVVKASRPERVKAITGEVAADAPGGDRQYTLKFVLQPLTPLAGRKVAVVGLLIGDDGADGINVSTVTAIGGPCD